LGDRTQFDGLVLLQSPFIVDINSLLNASVTWHTTNGDINYTIVDSMIYLLDYGYRIRLDSDKRYDIIVVIDDYTFGSLNFAMKKGLWCEYNPSSYMSKISYSSAGTLHKIDSKYLDVAGSVTSVNGKTGDVVINKTDIGLNNVDNTSDNDKPISSATRIALSQKQGVLISGTNIKSINNLSVLGSGNLNIDKTSVGLGNVDNTSDANKPISTATQAALDTKQNIMVIEVLGSDE